MSAAATVAGVFAVAAAALLLGVVLGIWLPMVTAAVCTTAMAADAFWRGLRRWRAVRRRAARHWI